MSSHDEHHHRTALTLIEHVADLQTSDQLIDGEIVHMTPFYVFSDVERDALRSVFAENRQSPYQNYGDFSASIENIASSNRLPAFFRDLYESIHLDRRNGKLAHLLLNSTVDENIPTLEHETRYPIR
ncbi:hypothetical protein BUMB_00565c [Candidatus Paraburkholderia calva]|nr:hypothetical protein BUMB_00565c [Candidatus Paraburkholderia calva]